MLEAAPPADVLPVFGSADFWFSVSLYENMGQCTIGWNVTYPANVAHAVAIYAGPPPSNPEAWLNAKDVSNQQSGSWNTELVWGSGYSAALLGLNATNNGWIYIGVATPVTKSSK
jgi:hypothetical protein